MLLFDLFCLVVVGFLWGATNPLIRLGSKGINNIKCDSSIKKFFLEIKYLLINWKYMLPFILNQFGSLIYVYSLQNINLSLAVPIANSLSFVFTAIMANLLGEELATKNTYIGVTLIAIGGTFCLLDKIDK